MTATYRAEVYREHGWLMISIPELGLLSQAEHWGEVELMARDVIALELGVDLPEVQVDVRPHETALRRLQASIDELQGSISGQDEG